MSRQKFYLSYNRGLSFKYDSKKVTQVNQLLFVLFCFNGRLPLRDHVATFFKVCGTLFRPPSDYGSNQFFRAKTT